MPGIEFLLLGFVSFVGAELVVFHINKAAAANRFVPPGINGKIYCGAWRGLGACAGRRIETSYTNNAQHPRWVRHLIMAVPRGNL
jgi:hypothetical protein